MYIDYMNLVGRLLKAFLLVVSLTPGAYADDNYIQGYLSAILEQKLGWQQNSYHLKVKNSVATITIKNKNKNSEHVAEAKRLFAEVVMLVDFSFIGEGDAGAATLPAYIQYPRGDYYKPLIADVKESQFFISFVQTRDDQDDVLVGAVGLGQNFGLYRWPGAASTDGWQLNFFLTLLSQFNMDEKSDDLLNSDYLVGLPLSFRYGKLSGRIRFYHQSSHLGDELILSGNGPEPVNLSFEALDVSLAYDLGFWTGMIGALKIVSHNPSNIEERGILAGINYLHPVPMLANGRFVAGISTNWLEDVNWNSGTSFKAGLEIGQSYPRRYGTRFMFEAYKGFTPFGQFYTSDIEYYGLGVYFDFN